MLLSIFKKIFYLKVLLNIETRMINLYKIHAEVFACILIYLTYDSIDSSLEQ